MAKIDHKLDFFSHNKRFDVLKTIYSQKGAKPKMLILGKKKG